MKTQISSLERQAALAVIADTKQFFRIKADPKAFGNFLGITIANVLLEPQTAYDLYFKTHPDEKKEYYQWDQDIDALSECIVHYQKRIGEIAAKPYDPDTAISANIFQSNITIAEQQIKRKKEDKKTIESAVQFYALSFENSAKVILDKMNDVQPCPMQ